MLLLPNTPTPPHSVPSVPLNLTISAVGRRSINLTWSPPANPNGILLFYQLEYRIVGSSDVLTLDVPAESLAASLEDLTPAQQYQVTVRANTSVGFGVRSAPVMATTGMDSECHHTHATPTTPIPQPQHTHATPTSHPQHTSQQYTTLLILFGTANTACSVHCVSLGCSHSWESDWLDFDY